MDPSNSVAVIRGGVLESRHTVHVAVRDAEGATIAALGDNELQTYLRSAAKPFQALPLVEEGVADRFGLTGEELALCCASHEGEQGHIETARSILAKAGADEELLQCGPHAPYAPHAAKALADEGRSPDRIHNNCSGKHAGMIALAIGMGWDPSGYHDADHPVQRRMLEEVVRWTGVPSERVDTGVDGCGIPCFAVPLASIATAYAAFASSPESGPGRVIDAMTTHPFMVGGTGRACTDVLEVAGDRVFVKLGAEGVYGGGITSSGIGFAIKVADGGRRAVEVALVQVLASLGVLTEEEVDRLAHHARPPVRNTRGEIVGEIRAEFTLPSLATAGH